MTSSEHDRIFYTTLARLLEQRIAVLLALIAPTGVAATTSPFAAAPARAAASMSVPARLRRPEQSASGRSLTTETVAIHHAGGPAARATFLEVLS